MKKQFVFAAGLAFAISVALVGCATGPAPAPVAKAPSDAEIVAILKASFKDSPSAPCQFWIFLFGPFSIRWEQTAWPCAATTSLPHISKTPIA